MKERETTEGTQIERQRDTERERERRQRERDIPVKRDDDSGARLVGDGRALDVHLRHDATDPLCREAQQLEHRRDVRLLVARATGGATTTTPSA
jgi:hypothetical protein